HGGVGTTFAGLRAAAPTVVIPFLDTQRFWGQRVHAIGAGPIPIPARSLTISRLADSVSQAVGDPTLRRRTSLIAARIEAERGISNAIEVFEQHVASHRL